MASFRAASVSFTYSVFIVVPSLAFRIPRKDFSVAFVVSTETPETFTVLRLRSPRSLSHGTPRKPRNALSVAYGKDTETHGKHKISAFFSPFGSPPPAIFFKRPYLGDLLDPLRFFPSRRREACQASVRIPWSFRGLYSSPLPRILSVFHGKIFRLSGIAVETSGILF